MSLRRCERCLHPPHALLERLAAAALCAPAADLRPRRGLSQGDRVLPLVPRRPRHPRL